MDTRLLLLKNNDRYFCEILKATSLFCSGIQTCVDGNEVCFLFVSAYVKRIGNKIFLLVWKIRGSLLCLEYVWKIGCKCTLHFLLILSILLNMSCRYPLFIFINISFMYVICKLIFIEHESPLNKDEKAFFSHHGSPFL